MNIKLMSIVLITILFSCNACVTPPTNNFKHLDKFQGAWKMNTSEMVMTERWQKTNDTLWEGKSFIVKEGKEELEETVQLILQNQTVSYNVKRKGVGTPVAFTLVKQEGDKFIFENKANDFPQQIIYHFKDDGTLDASINGTTKDGYKKFDFPYKRLKD